MPEKEHWIEIDKFKLDEECEEQVKLKLKYGLLLAEARKEEAKKKNELKVLMAEVDQLVRKDPASYGIVKTSEKAYEHAVLLDAQVQRLIGESIDAGHTVYLREAQVYALSDRKSMIEKEVDLFLSGYFAKPNTSGRGARQNWSERRAEQRDREMDEFFDSKRELD